MAIEPREPSLIMTTANDKRQTASVLFRITTFGCKVNQVDTAGLAQQLTEPRLAAGAS